MANGTACDHALQTTELLELMLLHIPPKQVLLVQRVCLNWRNTNSGSVKLQQALCFRPFQFKFAEGRTHTASNADPEIVDGKSRRVEPEDTTRIVHVQPSEASAEEYLHALAADTYRVANPMVTVPFGASVNVRKVVGDPERTAMVGTLQFELDAPQQSSASRQKMYLVQLPAIEIIIARGYKDRDLTYHYDTGHIQAGVMTVSVDYVVEDLRVSKVADLVSALEGLGGGSQGPTAVR